MRTRRRSLCTRAAAGKSPCVRAPARGARGQGRAPPRPYLPVFSASIPRGRSERQAGRQASGRLVRLETRRMEAGRYDSTRRLGWTRSLISSRTGTAASAQAPPPGSELPSPHPLPPNSLGVSVGSEPNPAAGGRHVTEDRPIASCPLSLVLGAPRGLSGTWRTKAGRVGVLDRPRLLFSHILQGGGRPLGALYTWSAYIKLFRFLFSPHLYFMTMGNDVLP